MASGGYKILRRFFTAFTKFETIISDLQNKSISMEERAAMLNTLCRLNGFFVLYNKLTRNCAAGILAVSILLTPNVRIYSYTRWQKHFSLQGGSQKSINCLVCPKKDGGSRTSCFVKFG